jgi:segregation and condensation protein A
MTKVQLPIFEGPLDLLLHLIKKNEVSVTDIPISMITEQYLATLELMQSLNLDVAGEFLVMAATLIHIKSRMLLPAGEDETDEEEGEDPREELVRRLLEYQRYKDAAEELQKREVLSRDVFVRPSGSAEEFTPVGFGEVSIFELISALQAVLARLPKEELHEVTLERISVRDKMTFLLEVLRQPGRVVFQDLFRDTSSRIEIVITFLALLELVKIRAIRIRQEERTGPIVIEPTGAIEDSEGLKAEKNEAGSRHGT